MNPFAHNKIIHKTNPPRANIKSANSAVTPANLA